MLEFILHWTNRTRILTCLVVLSVQNFILSWKNMIFLMAFKISLRLKELPALFAIVEIFIKLMKKISITNTPFCLGIACALAFRLHERLSIESFWRGIRWHRRYISVWGRWRRYKSPPLDRGRHTYFIIIFVSGLMLLMLFVWNICISCK